MSSKRDYYEVLGVSRECSCDELRKAYRREALKHHPDRNQGDAAAEAKFKEVNEAYQVLSDDEKRRIYDQFGHAGLEGGGGGGFDGISDVFSHMQDLFSEMFSGSMGFGGGGAPPPRRRTSASSSGSPCARPPSAASARSTVRAPDGVRRLRRHRRQGRDEARDVPAVPRRRPGVQRARVRDVHVARARAAAAPGASCGRRAPSCGGQGAVEKARKVNVTFPAGIDAGQRLRVPGQGHGRPARDGRRAISTSRSTSRATRASSATGSTS